MGEGGGAFAGCISGEGGAMIVVSCEKLPQL